MDYCHPSDKKGWLVERKVDCVVGSQWDGVVVGSVWSYLSGKSVHAHACTCVCVWTDTGSSLDRGVFTCVGSLRVRKFVYVCVWFYGCFLCVW